MLCNLVNHPPGSRLSLAHAIARASRRDPLLRSELRFSAAAEMAADERTAYGRDGGVVVLRTTDPAVLWLTPEQARDRLHHLWDREAAR